MNWNYAYTFLYSQWIKDIQQPQQCVVVDHFIRFLQRLHTSKHTEFGIFSYSIQLGFAQIEYPEVITQDDRG